MILRPLRYVFIIQAGKMKKYFLIFKDLKKVMIFNIILFLVSFLYCLPNSISISYNSIFKFIFLSTVMYSLIFQAKLNKFTGADEVFTRVAKGQIKYASFVISIPILLVAIFCFIKLLITKNFEYEIIIFAAPIGVHASLKVYDMYNKLEQINRGERKEDSHEI